MKTSTEKCLKAIVLMIIVCVLVSSTGYIFAQQISNVRVMHINHTLIFLPPAHDEDNKVDGLIELTIFVPPLGKVSTDAALGFYLIDKNGSHAPLLVSIPGKEDEGNTLHIREVNPSVGVQVGVTLHLKENLIYKLRGKYDKPVQYKLYAELLDPFRKSYYLTDISILDLRKKYK